jgi:hypothetical protein
VGGGRAKSFASTALREKNNFSLSLAMMNVLDIDKHPLGFGGEFNYLIN